MKIGEAAAVSGVSARSLRHYESEGLIVPGRRGNGYRDYCGSTISRVRVIRSLLDSGLPVRLIRDLLPHGGTGPVGEPDLVCAEILRDVRNYRDRLAMRITSLSDQRAALDAYLGEAGKQDR